MSATGAVRVDGREADKTLVLEKKTVAAPTDAKAAPAGTAAEAKLAVALEALTAIAGVNDLTSLKSLFRIRRRAEEALFRIRAIRDEKRPSA